MVANCDRNGPLTRRVLIAVSAFAIAFSLQAAAQSTSAADNSPNGRTFSSSTAYQAYLSTEALLGGGSSAEPSASASPQYGGNRSTAYPRYESRMSHVAFEAGGGFTSPIGNDTHGYDTYGYNAGAGAGWNFSKKFGALFEYQYNRNKIPGATIAAVGAQGGNINTHLFMFNPVYYFYSRKGTGAYVVGGAGYSRKVTNFTDLQSVQECYYFCYYGYAPVTVDHFSSNQAAADGGLGVFFKAFGPDSRAKLFAEARYVWVDSPKPTQTTNGEGTEGLIPVTFGIRF